METAKVKPTPKIYKIDIPCKDEFEMIENLIFQYSSSRYLRGYASFMLRKQLISLLSLYFKYGYSLSTKKLAAETFQVKLESLNSFNLELQKAGYLVNGIMSKREKELNPELKKLQEYYKGNGVMPSMILMNFVFEK